MSTSKPSTEPRRSRSPESRWGGRLARSEDSSLGRMCAVDLRGPRLTVELDAADDGAMAEHDFAPGTGRLLCSEFLRHYVLRE